MDEHATKLRALSEGLNRAPKSKCIGVEDDDLKNFEVVIKTGMAEKSISDMTREEIEAAGAPVWERVKKEC